MNAFQLWAKPLPAGPLGFTAAALVLNQQMANLSMGLLMADVPGLACGGSCLVHDVWNRVDFVQKESDPIPIALRAHQPAVFMFKPAGGVAPGSAEARAMLAEVAGRSIYDELQREML